jgi:beta-glucanase (GH16 family)
MLTKFLRTEGGSPLVAAALPKGANQTYGRYTVRFRADAVAGYKTAWLLWPDANVRWPDGGEIDFPEGSLNGSINAFMHFDNPNGGQSPFETSTGYPTWHTATTEWLPGKVTFILDDKVIGVATKQVPAASMHYVLQTETNIGGAAPPASAAGNVQVDWITIYARA